MRVSFFVLATGEVELLRRSLPAAAAERPDELVLVDNGADDAVAELGREHATRVVRLERRATYCEAMNAGLAECQGDAVALLQADTFVTPGYREAAVRALEADPGVGAVAPRLVRAHPDGSPTGELDTAGMVVDRRRKNGLVGHATPAAAWSRRGEVFGADGAAAVYRREALRDGARGDEVFDPDLERWAADADVAWRSRVLGWRAAYEPEAVVHHIRTYSPSTRAAMSAESRRMQFRNRYLMLVKN
ncbi:MAG TPA: glycosyltransferase, partial [Solirubrobacteraceae bacterium]|nr:glycosyltransferase [Solirubrobacteraceae bacterium]